MTAEYPQDDEPLIPIPALSLTALRQAVATVALSGLPEFFQEIQDAFTQAGEEDSVFPIRHFYQRRGAAIAIGRRPSVAARLHAAERALADPDPAVRINNLGSRRDRPGSLPRGRGWLTGTGSPSPKRLRREAERGVTTSYASSALTVTSLDAATYGRPWLEVLGKFGNAGAVQLAVQDSSDSTRTEG
jgi:hypothetical protein